MPKFVKDDGTGEVFEATKEITFHLTQFGLPVKMVVQARDQKTAKKAIDLIAKGLENDKEVTLVSAEVKDI